VGEGGEWGEVWRGEGGGGGKRGCESGCGWEGRRGKSIVGEGGTGWEKLRKRHSLETRDRREKNGS